MTALELQRLARVLGNQSWCRYWLHYNYPQTEPWEMAISRVSMRMSPSGNVRISDPVPVEELKAKGARAEVMDGLIYYIIARTDESGRPFRMEGP